MIESERSPQDELGSKAEPVERLRQAVAFLVEAVTRNGRFEQCLAGESALSVGMICRRRGKLLLLFDSFLPIDETLQPYEELINLHLTG